MSGRGYLSTLVKELREHGVSEYRTDLSGKHAKLYFYWRGEEKMLIYPISPSDSRYGVLHSLGDLRRLMGVKRIVKKSKRSRRRKTRSKGKALPKAPAISNPIRGMEQLAEALDDESHDAG